MFLSIATRSCRAENPETENLDSRCGGFGRELWRIPGTKMETENPGLLHEPSSGHYYNPESLCVLNRNIRKSHDFGCRSESNLLENWMFEFADFEKSQSMDSRCDQFRLGLKSIRPKIAFRVLSKCGPRIPVSPLFGFESARSSLDLKLRILELSNTKEYGIH